MISLFSVNEQNWLDIISLSVTEEQKKFLASPIGILARGYVYRSDNAGVFGISDGLQTVGVAMVRNLDEAPTCYDLQQFMIDRHVQNRGYGAEALRLILSLLSEEGKYDQVEVCVHKDDAAALRLYQKLGFRDTGYVAEDVPDCYNLVYSFPRDEKNCSDTLIFDFSEPLFQTAFRQYFSELGLPVRDWDGLFREMNGEGDNMAFVRTTEGGKVIGFLQCKPIKLTGYFFEETCVFLREFWVAEEFRKKKHGSELLRLAEDYWQEKGIYTSILTTDTAASFYEKHGYSRAPGYSAKNGDPVFLKRLG
ncbi:MAG: GNAT family N-acetyltransferase [bacterium]|nr:GNAT family N-acetyltransferase [bacterium]